MKKIVFDDPYTRKSAIDKDNEELYDIQNHKVYLHNIIHNIDHSYNTIIKRQIKQKFYSSQDKIKHIHETQHITLDELLSKLYDCNLKCYYCDCDLKIIYKGKGEKNQWSLERLDNNIGHYGSNTCISCLECNLTRNTGNYEYFKMGKQMKIKKV